MSVELNLNKAKDLGMWLHNRIDGLVLPQNDRVRIGGSLFHLAQEHFNAINILIESRLYGSAFALARPLFEAYVRGVWLLKCASDDKLQYYMKGQDKKLPRLGKLITEIENEQETTNDGIWLKIIKEKNYKQFNDLVHGGVCQVIRRNIEEGIQSTYPEEELSRLLKYSGDVAINTAARLFAVAGEELLLIELKEKAATIRQFWVEN